MRTRRTPLLLLLLLVVVLLGGLVAPAPLRADARLRSGTIVGGTGSSPANFWVRGMEGCVGAPTCSAWLQSMCSSTLAGQNPAVHASIVDVAELAYEDTERTLRVRGEIGINWGTFMVQFWDGWCNEIASGRIYGRHCAEKYKVCRFHIPSGAKWMTISPTPDNMSISWALT